MHPLTPVIILAHFLVIIGFSIKAENLLVGVAMENIVDKIRRLCWMQEPRTSITKLEETLGYANGTIGKWAKAKRGAPLGKVLEVATALGTTPEYLLGTEKTEAPKEAPDDAALKFALFGDTEDISDEDLEDVKRYAAFVRERKREQKKDGTP